MERIRRFLVIDPVGVDAGRPVSFNRYAYGNNSPYNHIDPDGRHPALLWGLGLGFAGSMGHSDYANTPAVDEAPTTMGPLDHMGALPGLNAAKGLKGVRMADKAKDANKTPDITTPYKRPSDATTQAQRESVQGKPWAAAKTECNT